MIALMVLAKCAVVWLVLIAWWLVVKEFFIPWFDKKLNNWAAGARDAVFAELLAQRVKRYESYRKQALPKWWENIG